VKYIADLFALIGLCATIVVVGFYVGYTTYQPQCGMWAAAFTKECK